MAPLSKPEPVAEAGTDQAGVPAATAESLNGAQVSSMLEILTSVSGGMIKPAGAVALINAAFPQLPAAQVQAIVAGVVPVAAVPAAAADEPTEAAEPDEPGEPTDGN
jgi:hypothetical protein